MRQTFKTMSLNKIKTLFSKKKWLKLRLHVRRDYIIYIRIRNFCFEVFATLYCAYFSKFNKNHSNNLSLFLNSNHFHSSQHNTFKYYFITVSKNLWHNVCVFFLSLLLLILVLHLLCYFIIVVFVKLDFSIQIYLFIL